MKLKKYTDPRIKAEALARAITNLGEAAARKTQASVELREEAEAALAKLAKIGLDVPTSVGIVALICDPQMMCQRCGRERPAREMNNWHCLECAVALRNIEKSKQFS